MNFLKGYVNSISDFVTSVIDEPSETTASDVVSQKPIESDVKVDEPVGDASSESTSGIMNWLPKLTTPTGENAVVYYMNSLASFGSEPEKDSARTLYTDENERIINEDVPESAPPTIMPTRETNEADLTDLDSDVALLNWFNGLSSRSGQVWNQIKQDFTEVMSSMSSEPKDAVTRTASSVRQHLSAVASAAKKLDPNQFSLLPESQEQGSKEAVSEQSTDPPGVSDVPSFANLRSDVGQFVSGVLSTLFGPDDRNSAPVKDRREARLQIIRADPATYELEPPFPPAHLGIHSYADWRAAYFDEVNCQPLPGIPLYGNRDAVDDEDDVTKLIQPAQPSPEELLEQNPFMRTYLSQLVRVDEEHSTDSSARTGISDADFWSRYYYRVWLLDVTEHRRQKLASRVGSNARSRTTALGSRADDQRETQSSGVGETDEPEEANDWFDNSDTEVSSPPAISEKTTASTNLAEPTKATTSAPPPSSTAVTQPKFTKRTGKQRKRRGKKRSEGDRDSESRLSDSDTERVAAPAPTPVQLVQTVAAAEPIPSEKINKIHSESEELVTSGSSSVVVLSNSEEDADCGAGHPSTCVSVKTVTAGAAVGQITSLVADLQPNLSDANSDDWGEMCEDDIQVISSPAKPLSGSSATPSKQELGEENEEVNMNEDWDNWS